MWPFIKIINMLHIHRLKSPYYNANKNKIEIKTLLIFHGVTDTLVQIRLVLSFLSCLVCFSQLLFVIFDVKLQIVFVLGGSFITKKMRVLGNCFMLFFVF